MNDIIIPQGCIEWPADERNWQYEEVFGAVGALPSKFSIIDNQFQNQNTAGYPYGCAFFGTSLAINAMNFLEGSPERSTGKELCDYAESIWLFDPKVGAYMISWPKVGKTLGHLLGYAQISTLDEIKDSIYNGRPVVFWTRRVNWHKTAENGHVIVEWTSYGHLMHLTGWDDDISLLTIKQSYGKENYDNGFIYLKYSDIWLIYPSKFSLIDKADEVNSYKKRIMENITIDSAKKAFENGLWSGTNPQGTASREEMAAVVQRAYDKLLVALKK